MLAFIVGISALQAAIPLRYAPTRPPLALSPSSLSINGASRRIVPLSRAQASHRTPLTLHSLARPTSSAPRAFPHLLLPRAARTDPSFSEKFAFHTPPFPNSTRTSSPYSEPSPRSTESAIGFLELHWCSRTPRTSANDPELTGVEAAAAAPPPPRRRRNPDHPRPPNRSQTTRGEPRILFPHFPVPSSPSSQGPNFIFFVCLGVSVQKSRDLFVKF
nr:unnamed protein product [Digitaria exilis]